ncbi:MAG: hypothetical protein ACLQU2_31525 [Candidatus Binataceae bacterium]
MVLSDTAGDMHPTIDQPIDDPRILEAQKEPLLQDFNLNFTYDTWYPQFNVAQNGKIIETPVEAINGQTPGEPAVHIIYKSPVSGQEIVCVGISAAVERPGRRAIVRLPGFRIRTFEIGKIAEAATSKRGYFWG